MEIKVEIRRINDNPESPVIAAANIIINECFIIKNAKLIDTRKGKAPFLAMPSYRGRDGNWRDVCHPLTAECRKEMEVALIDAYNAELSLAAE